MQPIRSNYPARVETNQADSENSLQSLPGPPSLQVQTEFSLKLTRILHRRLVTDPTWCLWLKCLRFSRASSGSGRPQARLELTPFFLHSTGSRSALRRGRLQTGFMFGTKFRRD